MIKNLFRGSLVTALLALIIAPAPAALAQGDEYDEARNLVQRVQDDLHTLHPVAHKDRERVKGALKHLSDLDRKFTKDQFRKAPLSDAIGNVQGILEHNTLDARERDTLNTDIHDLRELRLFKGR
jgi:hypothetical protein